MGIEYITPSDDGHMESPSVLIADLNEKVRLLEAENRKLRERNDELEWMYDDLCK